MNNTLRHIHKCDLCKQEIKKNSEKKQFSVSEPIRVSEKKLYDGKLMELYEPERFTLHSTERTGHKNLDIDNQLKIIKEKLEMMDHNNNKHNTHEEKYQLQYQNMLLQKTLTKYLEDSNEQKMLSNKLDKIYDLLNYNLHHKKELFNLSELQQPNSVPSNSIELSYINVGIFLLVILFVVDIVLRIVPNNKKL
jgi:hypothetical protein